MKACTVAALQVAPEGGALRPQTVRRNVERAAQWATRCVEECGAQLVVLPEAVSTGFSPGVDSKGLWRLLSRSPGDESESLADVATRAGAYIVVGTYERGPTRYVVYNSAKVYAPTGALLGTYRKTHLFAGERAGSGGWASPGDEVTVVDTPLGVLGMMICYDGDFPELARISVVLGAEILVRPSAFLRPADIWELTTRARAYDNHVFVIAANAVGRDAGGHIYFGNSLVVGPTGAVLARGTAQEGWVSASIDTNQMWSIAPGSSHPQLFDHLADRNLEVYASYKEELLKAATARFPHPSTGLDERMPERP